MTLEAQFGVLWFGQPRWTVRNTADFLPRIFPDHGIIIQQAPEPGVGPMKMQKVDRG